MPLQPCLHALVFMRGVIVDNEVNIQFTGRLRVNRVEELDPLLMTMSLHAPRNDFAMSKFDGRKERCRPVAFVVVRKRSAASLVHRQTLLRAIKSLNRRLLVHADHERVVGRAKIEPDDIAYLRLEVRIIADLEGLDEVWLEPICLEYAMNQRLSNAEIRGQRASTPVRRCFRLPPSGTLNDLRFPLIALDPLATSSREVSLNPCRSTFSKSTAPFADHVRVNCQFGRNLLVILPICRE
jgi:hypothetical protein